jgi:transposase InsO family protein
MKNQNIFPHEPSHESLFRYQIVSGVLVRLSRGESRAEAIRAMSQCDHSSTNGELKRVSVRSIYSWLKAYEELGFEGLLPKKRTPKQRASYLSKDLLNFFKQQKVDDPRVSVPELIHRAKKLGLINPLQKVDRTTIWRNLKQVGIETTRRKSRKNRDSRRFAYPHRMDMVVCDGKHFKAGQKRARRVALFFLDDSTRMGLHVVVGPSESAELFLRGFYETLLEFGLMSAMYVDNGPGFIANDSIDVFRKLNVRLVHGTAGYPEGRGKIERFNRTAQEDCLRFLDGNPEVDPDCQSLQLRLKHYLSKQYNLKQHESLQLQTPFNCFHSDPRPFKFQKNVDLLRQAFVLYEQRLVSKDNTISYEGTCYEVPIGHVGEKIILYRNILDKTISVIHKGEVYALSPVDLAANARSFRGNVNDPQPEEPNSIFPKGSAQLSYENDFRPIVDENGNYHESTSN